jgi:hypothetical protein
VLAQELGAELDGILADAPAMYWSRFQTAQMWGQVVMKEIVDGQLDFSSMGVDRRTCEKCLE